MCRKGGPYCYERKMSSKRKKELESRRQVRNTNKARKLSEELTSLPEEKQSDPCFDGKRTELFQLTEKLNCYKDSTFTSKGIVDRLYSDGGFSFRVDGTSPTTGFMASPYPERSVKIPAGETVSPLEIDDYFQNNEDLLSQEGHVLGGWLDPDNGDVYLDVSVRCEGAGEARKLCQEKDQIAFFDAQTGTSVMVDRNATSGQE